MPWNWGNGLGSFWGWNHPGTPAPPPDHGYALHAYSGMIPTNEYNFVTQAVTTGGALGKVLNWGMWGSNGTAGNSGTGLLDLAGGTGLFNNLITWSTHAISLSPNFNIDHNYGVSCASSTNTIMSFGNPGAHPTPVTGSNGLMFIQATLSYNHAANTFTTASTLSGMTQQGWQGMAAPTQGFYFGGSYTYSTNVTKVNDGPPAPNTNLVRLSVNQFKQQFGTATNKTQGLSQSMDNGNSDTTIDSHLYTFATGTSAFGVEFVQAFPNVLVGGFMTISTAVGLTAHAYYFESNVTFAAFVPTYTVATEVYNFANAAVTFGTTLPTPTAPGNAYVYPQACNSLPGHLQ
jgi:hypothetical protein